MSNNGTIDDNYFEWLYGKIGSVRNRNPSRSHWELAKQLYGTEFVWFVPNDDNRAGDGKDLRVEFMYETNLEDLDPDWLELECSVLEMLIALAIRVGFETSEETIEWFWRLMNNIGLRDLTDENYVNDSYLLIESTIEKVLYRKYKRNGDGGLFPLRHAKQDQRTVELWYQMSAYLLERDSDIGP